MTRSLLCYNIFMDIVASLSGLRPKVVWLLALQCAVAAASAADYDKTFDFLPGGRVTVFAGRRGDIAVYGWEKSSIRIQARKAGGAGQADRIDIRVRLTQLEAAIETASGLPGSADWRVDYSIYVPAARTDLGLFAGQGAISVSGVGGWIEVRTEAGDIRLEGLSGYASARSGRGQILIVLNGDYWYGSQLEARTASGDITLSLPPKYSAFLSAATRRGSIYVDYPPQVVAGEQLPLLPERRKQGSLLEARLGQGGAPVKLLTGAGDIKILQIKKLS